MQVRLWFILLGKVFINNHLRNKHLGAKRETENYAWVSNYIILLGEFLLGLWNENSKWISSLKLLTTYQMASIKYQCDFIF